MSFNEKYRRRTKKLALEIIALASTIPYSDAVGVLRKQLIRSCTSVAANFRAVCRARSDRERFAKLCIVVEEADETLFWLEMLHEGGFLSSQEVESSQLEAGEILKVMSSYKKKLTSE